MKKRSVSGCAVNPLTLNEVRRSEKLPKKRASERSSKRVRSMPVRERDLTLWKEVKSFGIVARVSGAIHLNSS